MALARAATEIISERGLSGLSLAEVGIRAGYSRGHVNYHFGSKTALIVEILEERIESLTEMLESTDKTGLPALAEVVDSFIEHLESDRTSVAGIMILISEAATSSEPELTERVRDYTKRIRDSFASRLRSDPSLRGVDADKMATLFLGTQRGLLDQWLLDRERFDPIAALQSLKESLLMLNTLIGGHLVRKRG